MVSMMERGRGRGMLGTLEIGEGFGRNVGIPGGGGGRGAAEVGEGEADAASG